jgi:hypothetical protein
MLASATGASPRLRGELSADQVAWLLPYPGQ